MGHAESSAAAVGPQPVDEMVRVVGIRFRKAGKIYYFDPGEADYTPGERVVVESEEGLEVGEVALYPKRIPHTMVVLPLRRVVRRLTRDDEGRLLENRSTEKEALQLALERAQAHGLDMKFVAAEVAFDGSRLRFFFVSEKRIDFRQLVRDLAGRFRARIELRQVGVRDQAKMVGGIGDCGRELCCTTWMGNFEPVSIRMAKLQNLSLNPSRLSGQCGRLKCCLKYENEMYREILQEMPRLGTVVETPQGTGRVVEVMAVKSSVLVDYGDGRRAVVPVDQLGSPQGVSREEGAAAGDMAVELADEGTALEAELTDEVLVGADGDPERAAQDLWVTWEEEAGERLVEGDPAGELPSGDIPGKDPAPGAPPGEVFPLTTPPAEASPFQGETPAPATSPEDQPAKRSRGRGRKRKSSAGKSAGQRGSQHRAAGSGAGGGTSAPEPGSSRAAHGTGQRTAAGAPAPEQGARSGKAGGMKRRRRPRKGPKRDANP